MTLKLGVPSKGRLMEKTFNWFAARGVTLRKSGHDREYAGLLRAWTGSNWCCCLRVKSRAS